MTLFLIIAGSIVAFIACILIIAVFAPVSFSGKFSYSRSEQAAFFRIFWINPFLIDIQYDIFESEMIIRLFGRKLKGKSEITKKREPEGYPEKEQPVQEDVAVPRTEPQISRQTQKTEIPESAKTEENESVKSSVAEPEMKRKKRTFFGGQKKKSVEKGEEKRENTISKLKNSPVLVFLKDNLFREKAIRWIRVVIKSLLGILSIDHFKIHARAGLEDPSDLGKIFGIYTSVVNGLNLAGKKLELGFEPVFMENRLELSGSIEVRSSVARFAASVVVAVFTFPYLRIWHLWRGIKNNRKVLGKK